MELKVPPPVQMLIFAIVMFLLNKALGSLAVELPFQKLVAIGVLGLGLAINLAGIQAFSKAKTTVNPMTPEKASKLVIVGIFKVSRNPMYLGMFFVLLACAVYLGNVLNLLVLAGFCSYYYPFPNQA